MSAFCQHPCRHISELLCTPECSGGQVPPKAFRRIRKHPSEQSFEMLRVQFYGTYVGINNAFPIDTSGFTIAPGSPKTNSNTDEALKMSSGESQ